MYVAARTARLLTRPYFTKVISCEVQPSGLDPFGCVKNGKLIVRGQLACPSSVTPSPREGSEPNLCVITRDGSETTIGKVFPDLGYHEEPLKEFVRLWCLHIVDEGDGPVGLMLTQVDKIGEVFRRVGLFFMREPWFNESKEQTITII